MDFFTPKYKRDPNAKVESLYWGVSNGGGSVTRLVKPSVSGDRMAATRTPGLRILDRGESGCAGILILGGMETTLDEMEYILEARKQKPFVQRRSGKEIADMCRLVIERRNEMIKYLRKNPSELSNLPKKRKVRLHLPVGLRYVPTAVPGLKVLAQI